MPSAVELVMSIVELLEIILVQLPMSDLLFVQGVCKYWQTVIRKSIKIQRRFFFIPAPNASPELNPLPLKRLLIRWNENGKDPKNHPSRHTLWVDFKGNSVEKLQVGGWSASWRHMLLVQPPCKYEVPMALGWEDRATRGVAETISERLVEKQVTIGDALRRMVEASMSNTKKMHARDSEGVVQDFAYEYAERFWMRYCRLWPSS